jgi:rhomboid family GlyGly-CTERM serine protease
MNVEAPSRGFFTRARRLLAALHWDGARGLILLALCLLLLLPEAGGDALRAAWRYERDAVAGGEWWRFATAHVVHLDPEHAVLNALGLVLMWSLFAPDFRPRAWLFIVLASVIAIDLGFWYRDRTLEWYVGSSGLLHGIMAAGTLAHIARRDLDGWLLGGFIVVKLAYEQGTGALPFASAGMPVIVNAHLYGSMGGVIAAAVLLFTRRGHQGAGSQPV